MQLKDMQPGAGKRGFLLETQPENPHEHKSGSLAAMFMCVSWSPSTELHRPQGAI